MSLLRSALLMLATLAVGAGSQAAPAKPIQPLNKPTIILVHGAFADGSSWNKIIPLLQMKGYSVVAVQNPLTSLSDDAAFTKRAIDNAPGDVILVGHSWGGMVITQAGDDPKVKALVYVSAFAPDVGQAVVDLGTNLAPTPGVSSLVPDASGFMALTKASLAQNFAQDLSARETSTMVATQGPWAAAGLKDKATVAAWKNRANYFIVAKQDRMIQPDLERAEAKMLNAQTWELNTSHVPMLSQPRRVAAVILKAAMDAEQPAPQPAPSQPNQPADPTQPPQPAPQPAPSPAPPMPAPAPAPAPAPTATPAPAPTPAA